MAAEAETPVVDQVAATEVATATNNTSAMEVEKKEEDDCNFKIVDIDETAKVSRHFLGLLNHLFL